VNRTHAAIFAVAFGLAGAILAFALADDGKSVGGVKLQPLGVILLAVGVLVLAGLWLGGVQSGDHDNNKGGGISGIQAVGGLIAVVAGILAVCVLSALTLTRLDGTDKASIVAVTTSAFGIISAVVGAYLGIKISSEAAGNATVGAKQAAVAKNEAQASQQKVEIFQDAVSNELPTDQAAKVFAAVGRKEPGPPDPPPGGAA
jgi:hypothetical protein